MSLSCHCLRGCNNYLCLFRSLEQSWQNKLFFCLAALSTIKVQLGLTRTLVMFRHSCNQILLTKSECFCWPKRPETWAVERTPFLVYKFCCMSPLENLSSSCSLPIGTEVTPWSQSGVWDACLNLVYIAALCACLIVNCLYSGSTENHRLQGSGSAALVPQKVQPLLLKRKVSDHGKRQCKNH